LTVKEASELSGLSPKNKQKVDGARAPSTKNLTVKEAAKSSAKKATVTRGAKRFTGKEDGSIDPSSRNMTASEAAEEAGCSPVDVKRRKYIEEHGIPELIKALDSDIVTKNRAWAISKLPKKEQRALAKKGFKADPKPRKVKTAAHGANQFTGKKDAYKYASSAIKARPNITKKKTSLRAELAKSASSALTKRNGLHVRNWKLIPVAHPRKQKVLTGRSDQQANKTKRNSEPKIMTTYVRNWKPIPVPHHRNEKVFTCATGKIRQLHSHENKRV
jgi:hypothetical protein